ncbi:MAG: PTS sugar transporter subunit IIA [Blastococcus sp.]
MADQSLLDLLPEDAVRLDAPAGTWRDAVRLAGDLLVTSGATAPAYTDEMIRAIETLGPYVVLAPGLALAHARPSPAVHRTGLSWVTLAEPVAFGHATNDPVHLVVGLAGQDHDSHVAALAQLAVLLGDAEHEKALLAAESPAELRRLLSSLEGNGIS